MDYSNYLLLCVLSLLAIAPVSGGDQQPVARIINGQDSGYVPHAARITGFSMEYSTIGSGTFVTLRHLITAADIVRNMTIFYVDYGNESMGAAKTLSGLGFTHPDYDPVTFKNDIAIVIVNSDTDPSKKFVTSVAGLADRKLLSQTRVEKKSFKNCHKCRKARK